MVTSGGPCWTLGAPPTQTAIGSGATRSAPPWRGQLLRDPERSLLRLQRKGGVLEVCGLVDEPAGFGVVLRGVL